MTSAHFNYASSSAVLREQERTSVVLTANERRPVHLNARITRDVFPIRLALSMLCAVMLGEPVVGRVRHFEHRMDSLVTVHPDRLTFEAFSSDGSAYGRVSIDTRSLESDGEIVSGSSTVDINGWLWESISELRSSQETWLRVDSSSSTMGARLGPRSNRRVELPGVGMRRLLEMQVAACSSRTRLALRPVDLLSTLRASRSTEVMRFVLEPGKDAAVVLEPWEEVIRLRGARYGGHERLEVRTWGRRWLRLLASVLPHAEASHVFLSKSGWPCFYAVELPSVSIVLGVPGDHAWSNGVLTGSRPLASEVPPEFLAPVLAKLVAQRALSIDEVIEHAGLEPERTLRALVRLCSAGRALYELETDRYRHREMFEVPMDIASLASIDSKKMAAEAFVRDGVVALHTVHRREQRERGARVSPRYVSGVGSGLVWALDIEGVVGGVEARAVVRDGGRVVFGSCSCPHFREWMMSRGPCSHMLALLIAAQKDGGCGAGQVDISAPTPI